MKQILFLLFSIALSIHLFGQTNRIKVLSIAQTTEGYEVKGTSESMPGNETERHFIALYDALREYITYYGADSITIIEDFTTFSDDRIHSKRSYICYIDYSILQVLVDERHKEHIVLKITPGKHELFYEEETDCYMINNDIVEMTTYEKCSFSLFQNPFIVKRKMNNRDGKQITTTYNIGSFNRVFLK